MAGRKAISGTLGALGALTLALGLMYPAPAFVAWLGAASLVLALVLALTAPVATPHPVYAGAPALRRRTAAAPEWVGRVDATTAEDLSPLQEPPARTELPVPQEVECQPPPAPAGVEPSDALEAFVAAASEVGALVAAHLWLLDPATRTMRLVTAFGEMLPNLEPQPVQGTVLGEATESGTALLRRDHRREHDGIEETVWRYAVPLVAGEATGCAAIDFVADEPDAERLNRAAALTRGALTGSLSLHMARSETAAAHALVGATRDVLRLLDQGRIVEAALRHAVALSSADTGSIMLLEPGTREMTIRASIGLPERVVSQTRVSEGEGIAGWVLASRRSMVVEDLEDKGPRSRRHGIRSAMAVPIIDEEGILGVINVGSRAFHARFSASQLAVLESLGGIVALAIRNAEAHESSRGLYLETVRALALALETKDPYSRGTTDRVHDLAVSLGKAIGLTGEEQQALRVGALLHDIGMAAAGDIARAGARPLSTVEWAALKMHPAVAADVLDQSAALRAAVPIVYHHHEHYDGQGYVLGLAGEQIPLGARILAVADAYVAMTSPRAYRPARSHSEAVAEIEQKAGTQFDPAVVRTLVELHRAGVHAAAE